MQPEVLGGEREALRQLQVGGANNNEAVPPLPRYVPAETPEGVDVQSELWGRSRVCSACLDSVWADRLRMLGNGVVPAQAAEAWRFLWERLK